MRPSEEDGLGPAFPLFCGNPDRKGESSGLPGDSPVSLQVAGVWGGRAVVGGGPRQVPSQPGGPGRAAEPRRRPAPAWRARAGIRERSPRAPFTLPARLRDSDPAPPRCLLGLAVRGEGGGASLPSVPRPRMRLGACVRRWPRLLGALSRSPPARAPLAPRPPARPSPGGYEALEPPPPFPGP